MNLKIKRKFKILDFIRRTPTKTKFERILGNQGKYRLRKEVSSIKSLIPSRSFQKSLKNYFGITITQSINEEKGIFIIEIKREGKILKTISFADINSTEITYSIYKDKNDLYFLLSEAGNNFSFLFHTIE